MFSSRLTLHPGRVSAPFPYALHRAQAAYTGAMKTHASTTAAPAISMGQARVNHQETWKLLPGVGFSPVKNATQLLTEQELS